MELVDDRVFVPERIGGAAGFLHVSPFLIGLIPTCGLDARSSLKAMPAMVENDRQSGEQLTRKMWAGMTSGRSAT